MAIINHDVTDSLTTIRTIRICTNIIRNPENEEEITYKWILGNIGADIKNITTNEINNYDNLQLLLIDLIQRIETLESSIPEEPEEL